MSDLQGNLQEIRRLVEQSAKADEERKKTLQAQKLENLRDSFARIAFDHALSYVDFIDQKSGKTIDGDIIKNIADIAYDFADACMISRMDVPSQSFGMKTHKIVIRPDETWEVHLHDDGRLQIVDALGRQRHTSSNQASTGIHLAMQLAKLNFRSEPNADKALVMAADIFKSECQVPSDETVITLPAESLAETFTQLQHAPSEDHHKSAWHQGPPPVRDDGTIILVKIDTIDTRSEGWPFVVRCWARGVTTVSGSEWAYPSVAVWCEIPK